MPQLSLVSIASSAFPHTSPTNIKVGVCFCFISRSHMNITCHERPYLSCVHCSHGDGRDAQEKNQQKIAQVTEAFLKMKKFDIAKLKDTYEGK
jgi:hypothetical protein